MSNTKYGTFHKLTMDSASHYPLINKDVVYKTAFQNISDVSRQVDHMYHMDGSVSRCLVLSAFCTGYNTKGVRLGDSATILQAELIARSLALRCPLFEDHGQTYPSDNILYTMMLWRMQFFSLAPMSQLGSQ